MLEMLRKETGEKENGVKKSNAMGKARKENKRDGVRAGMVQSRHR